MKGQTAGESERMGVNRTTAELAAIRADLLARLAALRASSATTAEDRKPVVLDQSSVGRLSRIDAMQMQEMAQAAERRRETDIQRIEAALRRIQAGDYGYCVLCDEPIGEQRLAADPAVPTCIDCAAQAG